MIPWIAWRFMLRGTDRGRFSPLTLFAWVAIGLGIGAMTGLISVMFGFEASLKARVLSASPHVKIAPKQGDRVSAPGAITEKLRSLAGVERVVPYVESEMIIHSSERTLGAIVWGIPREEFTRLATGVERGSLPSFESEMPEALVAVELSHRLQINPGSDVRLISPLQSIGSMALVPVQGTFRVTGVYASGHYEFDQQHLFVFLEDAQDLLRMDDAVHGWQIWGREIDLASGIALNARQMLGPEFDVQGWEEFNSALFQSLKLEQFAMFTILSLAVLVAVLNVGITLAMHVTYKRRNIGILRALGASERKIRGLFVWQGVWLGLVGMAIGGVITAAFFGYVRFYSQYQLPEIYYDRSLPIEMRPVPTLIIYIVCGVLVLLSTYLPARAAARLDPIAAIRE